MRRNTLLEDLHMKKSIFLIAVLALALTICSCETQNTGDGGADSTAADSTAVQAGVTFGDSGAPGGAADVWQSSVRD